MYSILISTLMIRRLSTKLKRFTSSVHLIASNNQPIRSIQGSQTLPIIKTGLITSASSWGVVHYVEFLLQGIHQYSSLPWWAVIMGTTIVLRTFITVPLAVHQNKILAQIELLKPTIIEYSEAIKHNIVIKCRRENLPSHVASMRYKKEVNIQLRHVHTYIHTHIRTYIYIHTCTYIRNVHIYTYMHIRTYIHLHTYIYIYIHNIYIDRFVK